LDDDLKKKKADPAKKKKKAPDGSAGILGLGLDGNDGHTRITSGKNFKLVGGSKDTHEAMQETAIKINEELDRRHTRLEDVKPGEFRDILHKAKRE
jgi:hypothetical protein